MDNFYQEIILRYLEYWGYTIEQRDNRWWVLLTLQRYSYPSKDDVTSIAGIYETEEEAYKAAFKLAVDDTEFDYWI